MALFFGKKEKKEVKKAVQEAAAPKGAPQAASAAPSSSKTADVLSAVLVRPRITEKATALAEKGVYVFDVAMNATKERIGAAVKELYRVTPRKINVIAVTRKAVHSTRSKKVGYTAKGKKAYVYLKKGDVIELA